MEKKNASPEKNQTRFEDNFSKEEFIKLVKEGEKGPFYPIGTFEDFKAKVMSEWHKKYGK